MNCLLGQMLSTFGCLHNGDAHQHGSKCNECPTPALYLLGHPLPSCFHLQCSKLWLLVKVDALEVTPAVPFHSG